MPTSKLVSIKNPVMNAFDDMGIDISRDVPVFTRWAAEAERNGIASFYSLRRKRAVLTVQGCVAPIPCEASFVQGAILGDHGCDCGELFDRCFSGVIVTAMHADNSFLVVDVSENDNLSYSRIKWDVRQGMMVFSDNLNGKKVTIQYLGFDEDADGFPMVSEGHVMAIVAFIMYKYAARSRFSPNKMDHGDLAHFWKEWMRMCSEARADDAMLSDSDRQEIVAMIHDPYIGYGMEVGMHSRGEL